MSVGGKRRRMPVEASQVEVNLSKEMSIGRHKLLSPLSSRGGSGRDLLQVRSTSRAWDEAERN